MKVSRLGRKKVLVSFPSLEASSSLGGSIFNLNQAFISLERWVPSQSVSSREVWVHCFGVPLYGWDSEIFKAIGGKVGEVVEIARETVEKLNLQFGRVRLKTDVFG